MNKKVRNILIMFFSMILVLVLSGCTDSDEDSNAETRER